MTPRAVEIRLPRVLPSWNQLNRSLHPRARASLTRDWHTLTAALCLTQLGAAEARRPFARQVRIFVSCAFPPGARRFDPDNLCAKLAIDGLKGLVLAGDTPDHVHSVTLGPCTRGERAETLIRIEEVA